MVMFFFVLVVWKLLLQWLNFISMIVQVESLLYPIQISSRINWDWMNRVWHKKSKIMESKTNIMEVRWTWWHPHVYYSNVAWFFRHLKARIKNSCLKFFLCRHQASLPAVHLAAALAVEAGSVARAVAMHATVNVQQQRTPGDGQKDGMERPVTDGSSSAGEDQELLGQSPLRQDPEYSEAYIVWWYELRRGTGKYEVPTCRIFLAAYYTKLEIHQIHMCWVHCQFPSTEGVKSIRY